MNHHRILTGVAVRLPDPLIDFLRWKHPSGISHQQIHNLQLCGSELYQFAVRLQFTALWVIGQASVDNLALTLLRVNISQQGVAAQLAPYPGGQLLRIIGLGHIVIRPHGEAEDLVGILTFGRENDDRQVPLFPDAHEGGKPVKLRHHHVDKDEPYRRVKRLLHRLQPIVCPADGIPLPLQHDGDSPYDLTVIIDHENAFVHSEFLP